MKMLNFLSQNRSSQRTPLTSGRLAGPGYIILNVIRAMNIIALLAVVTASMVMVVRTFTVSKFYFFDGATHIITAITAMFLVASECSIFKSFFAKNWPILSYEHGFGFLGFAMIVLGNNTLGNLNKDATSQQSLGMAFWQVVISSGIVVFILGFVNIAASIIFRDRRLGVTARQIRSKGAVAISEKEADLSSSSSQKGNSKPSPSIVTSFSALARPGAYSPSQYSNSSPEKTRSPVRAWAARARDSILPSYRSQVPPYPAHPEPAMTKSPMSSVASPLAMPSIRQVSRDTVAESGAVGAVRGIEISAPMNVNPQFAHLVRPDIAMHPSQRNNMF